MTTIERIPLSKVRLTPVTAGDIATVERMLWFIDLNNEILAAASQWVFIWQAIRDLALRIDSDTLASHSEIKDGLQRLLRGGLQLGENILSVIRSLDLTRDHVITATGCSVESMIACVKMLGELEDDLLNPVDPAQVTMIWKEVSGEPNGLVQEGN